MGFGWMSELLALGGRRGGRAASGASEAWRWPSRSSCSLLKITLIFSNGPRKVTRRHLCVLRVALRVG